MMFRVVIEEIKTPADAGAAENVIERLRVTVDASGALDHAAIINAVQRTKRIYTPRKARTEA